jgi:LAO/AO transport system kinase
LVETVGVGQTELDVMRATDTVIVTLVPEAGDSVQVMKAGLMEIADIFVVNKADRDGAQRMMTDLSLMLELKYSNRPASEADQPQWKIPVLATQAVNNIGITELYEAIHAHHQFLADTQGLERHRKARRREELLARIEYQVRRRLTVQVDHDPVLAALFNDVSEGKLDSHTASAKVLSSEFLKNEG